jgi:hypothetical protein
VVRAVDAVDDVSSDFRAADYQSLLVLFDLAHSDSVSRVGERQLNV